MWLTTYKLKSNPEFIDVFDKKQNHYPDCFEKLGEKFLKIYNYLNSLKEPIKFELTDNQQIKFFAFFKEAKKEVSEHVSTDLEGTVNRLGLIYFRLSMIFTVLETFDTGEEPHLLLCEDKHADNALRITKILFRHSLAIYYEMPKRKAVQKESQVGKLALKQSQILQLIELKKEGKSYWEMAILVFNDDKMKSKVYRYLNS